MNENIEKEMNEESLDNEMPNLIEQSDELESEDDVNDYDVNDS